MGPGSLQAGLGPAGIAGSVWPRVREQQADCQSSAPTGLRHLPAEPSCSWGGDRGQVVWPCPALASCHSCLCGRRAAHGECGSDVPAVSTDTPHADSWAEAGVRPPEGCRSPRCGLRGETTRREAWEENAWRLEQPRSRACRGPGRPGRPPAEAQGLRLEGLSTQAGGGAAGTGGGHGPGARSSPQSTPSVHWESSCWY